MRKIIIALCIGFMNVFAQTTLLQQQPELDYYASAYKLSGTELRLALHTIIKGHTSVTYDALWTHFQTTDKKSNGKVWDMYSDIPGGTPPYEFTYTTNQCGNYSVEGDCYNREHSWPKSWFNDLTPMYSDLFHLFPTDGKVNGMRSNYNYGNVSAPTWTSKNGSKLGQNTFPGYSGIVFEPITEYKGDLARGHFYMSVRYYTEDAGWAASDGTSKTNLLPWYANLLFSWHVLDTVSTKEINRNNAIFGIQKNRNPFIDHPEFAAEIWQTAMAPSVVTVKNPTATTLIVDLSRYTDSTVSVDKNNFVINNAIGSPTGVVWGVNNDVSKLLLTVPALASGTTYALQILNLKSINNVVMKDTMVSFKTSGVAAVHSPEIQLPEMFMLMQNYPNPFNPTTNIEFSVPSTGQTTLTIFNVLGQEVATLFNGEAAAGIRNHVQFAAHDLSGGMYLARLTSGRRSHVMKLTLIK